MLLVLCTVGCQLGDSDELASGRRSIVNGDLATGDEAVVALTHRGRQFCTGTLIGERTVVTAAHCLPPHKKFSAASILVFFGPRIDDPDGVSVNVADVLVNRAWEADLVANDIGLIALAEAAPVRPVPLAYADLETTSAAGDDARVVGFGMVEADGGGNGVKRQGTAPVERITASNIHLTSGQAVTCTGDSGGPLFLHQNGVEVLAGIHTRSDCAEQQIAERVDVHVFDFVRPFLARQEGEASCARDSLCAEGCAQPDPDCPCSSDGMCDSMCMHPEADLDCVGACALDGVCNEDCDVDGDCGCVGDGCDASCDAAGTCDEPAGCATGGAAGSGWWGALALAVLAWRRRDRQILSDRR